VRQVRTPSQAASWVYRQRRNQMYRLATQTIAAAPPSSQGPNLSWDCARGRQPPCRAHAASS
jgi:hypothetical protein